MIDAETVKRTAKQFGADLVGITPMDRFHGAPKQNDPRYIFPEATVMIVLAYRIPRGIFRGVEEGTLFSPYPSLGYAGINLIYGPMVLWQLARFIEDEGYDAVPVANINGAEAQNIFSGNFKTDWSIPVAPGKPCPDVLVNIRFAAFLAGLGEIGYSRIFLSPEFGPMQRFNFIITDAPLEPDPIYSGPPICDRCKICVRTCPGALSANESDKVILDGHEVEFAKIDYQQCLKGIRRYVSDGGSPFIHEFPSFYGYGNSNEAGQGCIRACYAHLEQKGTLTKKFKSKFRKNKPWSIEPGVIPPLPQHVIEDYVEKGRVETSMPVSGEAPKPAVKKNNISSPW